MIIRWFFSKTVRQIVAMRRHVWKLLNAQRDLLPAEALAALNQALEGAKKAVCSGADNVALKKEMQNLEQSANRWLKPYPHPGWRENVEVLLVALAVAMGIRTFFLQPFKIPTGSMQPTLWGVTSTNLINHPEIKIPTGLKRLREWFAGVSYVHVVAKADGPLEFVGRPWPPAIFSIFQRIRVGGRWHVIWFPPDYGAPPTGTLAARAGLVDELGRLRANRIYRKGDDVIRLRVNAGDHVFVDRFTYNFRRPKRGEIVVFETKGVYHPQVPQGQFYIKRLVGLGGETIRLKCDYILTNTPMLTAVPVGHLLVDQNELSANTPHFQNLYSFPDAPTRGEIIPYRENSYFGHALTGNLGLPPEAPGQRIGREYFIRPNHYFVMGDNTMNSLDSRYFGDFARDYVIGKSWFVYWPISSRFGLGYL